MDKGIISGNQVVDLEVEVYFGKDHPVDSSEQAFKTASATAFRKAFDKARPVLLEPIVSVEVTVPAANFGDISADMSTRRGHITGMDSLPGGLQIIQAVVPLAEMLSYATQLKSMTGGQGSFTMEFAATSPFRPTSSSRSSSGTRSRVRESRKSKASRLRPARMMSPQFTDQRSPSFHGFVEAVSTVRGTATLTVASSSAHAPNQKNAYPTSSPIGLPPSTTFIGRPRGVVYWVSTFIPMVLVMVAIRSITPTGRSDDVDAVLVGRADGLARPSCRRRR